MSFVKINAFQKGRAERSNNNVQYVENIFFFNLKPRKRIALHQIHKIMLFLATSYDPFKAVIQMKISGLFNLPLCLSTLCVCVCVSDGFTGIYSSMLSPHCWSADSQRVLMSCAQRCRKVL